jgi:hypothetical protein
MGPVSYKQVRKEVRKKEKQRREIMRERINEVERKKQNYQPCTNVV